MTLQDKTSIKFDESKHSYSINGVAVPSVTQILESMGLYPDYPERQRDFYLARGAAFHKACQLHDHGLLARVDERLHGYMKAWSAFLKDSVFRPTLIEHPVGSVRFGYCGTLDRFGYLGKDSALLDIKSGDAPACTGLQLSAYRLALVETGGEEYRAKRRLAVQLTPEGQYKVTEYHNHGEDERMFLMALSLWGWREQNV